MYLLQIQRNSTQLSVWMLRLSVLLFILIGNSLSGNLLAQNQTAKKTAGDIWYWEYLPPDYNNNTDDYPIMIFFHGLGERGNVEADLPKVLRNGPPEHVKNGVDFPFILISPQLKTNLGNWPPWYMDEVVETALSELRVDRNRIYITGLSLGGGGAWFYAQNFPEKIAAVAPIAGSRNRTSDACNIAAENVPVWAFHGDADGTVSVNLTINMVNAINACSPPPDPLAMMTIYPGVGHNSWDRAYRTDNSLHTPNLYEWFLMQSKGASLSVNAGNDKSLTLPQNSTNLSGTASSSGTITSYTWSKVSGPTVTLTNQNTSTVSLSNMVEGVYTFRLTVTDDQANSSSDDVIVTVVAANQTPIANAGVDKTIKLPTNSLTIFGSGSDNDGSIVSYNWTKLSGGSATLTNATTANLSVSNLVVGVYTFELTVTDDDGATDTDQVQVTVNEADNVAPTANAGADKNIVLPTNSVNLAGSGSDTDGSIVSYLWEKVSGATVSIVNGNLATATINGLAEGSYIFSLTVTDDAGATASDNVTVNVTAANQPPTVNAGTNKSITLPTSSTNLSGTASDTDGTISSYLWQRISGPTVVNFSNASGASTSVSGLTSQGLYTMRLTVTDDDGATAFDELTVTVNSAPVNQPPTVNAGSDKVITLPVNSTSFTASSNDTDGTIASIAWSKVSGGSATLSGQTTNTLSVSNLVAGSYRFRATVTDDDGATGFDEVDLTVNPQDINESPVSNAGPDKSIVLPTNSLTLNGSGTDNDGTIASYSWVQVSGATATLSGQSTANLSVSNLSAGTYSFELTVMDDDGATDSDVAQVTVTNSNVAPVANAGNDKSITLPTNQVTLTGSGTDADGTISAYLWEMQSGPAAATFGTPSAASTTATGLIEGLYVFKLTVTDNDGASGSDLINVTVNSATNQTPVVNAGSDVTISLSNTTVNLTGSASDPDGTIASVAWTQISGPSASLANQNTLTVTVSNYVGGTYVFRLTAIDNMGASSFDEVTLNVTPTIMNTPPTANAGSNNTLTLPTNSLVINGSGSDSDGTVVSYLWAKVSGPAVTMNNTTSPSLSLSNLVEGNYTFRLTVTDDDGATGADETSVAVLPETVNQPPIANAGSDINIFLPTNSVTIFGSGSDSDGSIQAYEWLQVSGPAATLSNTTTATLSVADLVEGTFVFSLMVTDDDGAESTDEVTVIVNPEATNSPPTANAGADVSINLPTTSTVLNGSGSDNDGTIVSYQWVKLSGPTATLSNETTANLALSGLVEGTYTFRLSVTDDDGANATDQATLTVFPESANVAPTVNAGSDKNIILPTNTVNLIGTAGDSDGTVTSTVWTKVSGGTATLSGENTLNLVVSGLVEGSYTFRLTATDNDGATASDNVIITVQPENTNQAPVANAGQDFSINLPTNSTTIDGTATDNDGSIVTTTWSKISGPSATLSNENTLTLSVGNMLEGVYEFRLRVEDNEGAIGEDFVNVTVNPEDFNNPPTVNAGANRTIQLPDNSVELTATASDDGTIASIIWQKLSGPTGETITGATTSTVTLSDLVEGTYTFEVTVTDDGGLTASDNVNVVVLSADEQLPNQPPVVDAGEDILVEFPNTTAELSAVASDPDDILAGLLWSQVSGPSTATIAFDTAFVTSVSDLIEGEYTFRVTATDALGESATDDVMVTVQGEEIVEEEEEEAVKPKRIFSPNGDGIDDFWIVENVEELSSCQLLIFNRQGDEIFSTVGYQNNWNGTDSGGTPLKQGVYFYVFRCSEDKNTVTGSITIIR